MLIGPPPRPSPPRGGRKSRVRLKWGSVISIRPPHPSPLPPKSGGEGTGSSNHLHSQRLKQSRGKAPPGDAFELLINPIDEPHIAVKSADDRSAIRKEVVSAAKEECVERVVEWQRDRIDDVGRLRVEG